MPPKDYEPKKDGMSLDEFIAAIKAAEQRKKQRSTTCPMCSGHGRITTTTNAPDHA